MSNNNNYKKPALKYFKNNKLVFTAWKASISRVFPSVFSHIWTEYGEIFPIFPYAIRIRENTDQKISK